MSAAATTGLLAQVTAARAEARRRCAMALARGEEPTAEDLAHVQGEDGAREVEREARKIREMRSLLPVALEVDARRAALAEAVRAHAAAVDAARQAEHEAGLKVRTRVSIDREVLAARERPVTAFAKMRQAEAVALPAEQAVKCVLRLAGQEVAGRYGQAETAAERARVRLKQAEAALADLSDTTFVERAKAMLSGFGQAAWSAFADGDDARRRAAQAEQARLRGEVEAREAPNFSEKIREARREVEQAKAEVASTAGGAREVLLALAAGLGLEVDTPEPPATNQKKKRTGR